MKLKIKERSMTTIKLSNKENVPIASDEDNSISKLCASMDALSSDIIIQRTDIEWTNEQKMLLAKRLVSINSDTYKHSSLNDTYRRLNLYFQHREIAPSTGVYDCRINPFNYKSAIGTVSFTNPNA